MLGENNKRVVRTYLDLVWRRGDLEGSAVLLDPGYRRHVAPGLPPLDVEGQRLRLHSFREAFADLDLRVEEMIAEQDLVCFRFTMSGTHMGEFQGIAPTGSRVVVPGLDLVRLKDGLLVEHWGGADVNRLRSLLG